MALTPETTSSQGDPLPDKDSVPFRLISKTIASGSYASIRKAVYNSEVIAVKFIHKGFAIKPGRLTRRQLDLEVTLHSHVNGHTNIIQFYEAGEDRVWRWIAMEYASGGDLFDKIEADIGVPEDVAHCYFLQLVSAVSFMHSKGVAHRDIKPENLLLSSLGELKLADFGLAALFSYNGQERLTTAICGSPPYVAPEVVKGGIRRTANGQPMSGAGYRPDRVDIWSCAVVLFVLLVGNTPWDEPTSASWEFEAFVRGKGRSEDGLWQQAAPATLSLLRGMMRVDPAERWTLGEVRQHPWFTRSNPYLTAQGKLKSPVSLATTMIENLKIDFAKDPLPDRADTASSSDFFRSTTASSSADVEMMNDDDRHIPSSSMPMSRSLASTQPETPTTDMTFDWERPLWSASQPIIHPYRSLSSTHANNHHGRSANLFSPASSAEAQLSEDPSMSQFSPHPSVPLSLTQRAQQFQDIVPSHSLTRFFSHLPHRLLLPLLAQALHRLAVPVHHLFSPSSSTCVPASGVTKETTASTTAGRVNGGDGQDNIAIKVNTTDGRRCLLKGLIVVQRSGLSYRPDLIATTAGHDDDDGGGDDMEDDEEGKDEYFPLLEIHFVKFKGDPLEWRRFFKKVVVLCKDGVFIPRSSSSP